MRLVSGVAVLFAVFAASFQFTALRAEAFPIQLGLSPDNSQSLLIQTIDSAQQEILINVYQFDSPEVSQALVHKISQGITVRILLEGQPLGKISDAGDATISAITHAMHASKNKKNRFFLMTSETSNRPRRYRYDHAKYVVVDGRRALLASENFTTTGHPNPGYVGNRGWEVVVEDSNLASQLKDLFNGDTSQSFGDIRDVTIQMDQSMSSDSKPKIRHTPPISMSSAEASSATLVTSPNSLAGIVGFIHSAGHTLELEEMSLPLQWKSSGKTEQNPIVSEAIAAAKRGVKVRILLNDDTVFGGEQTANQETVSFLKRYARCAGIDLEARIVNVPAVEITYIHNKGMIADGAHVFVSSINGTRNAVMNNRETAVDLQSRGAAGYFESAFDFDWSHSAASEFPETSSCSELTISSESL